MEVVLATGNIDKIREIKKTLYGLPLTILTFQDFPDFPSPEETGASLKENALIKAKAVAHATGKLSLADDSGLEVEALGGRPGVYSSRFAGENASYEDNNRKLLSLLKGIPEEKRRARFRCVMALFSPQGKRILVEGVCPGRITAVPRGKQGFGYDPVFEPEGLGKTFSQIPLSEKNKISHRAKALAEVREIFEELAQAENKFLMGLTGSMGCGKSTLARFFQEWGWKVVNADKIGHSVLQQPEIKRRVVEVFGDEILNNKREVSRAKLRSKIASHGQKMHLLNNILHPVIKKRIWDMLKLDTSNKPVVVEAALIFEAQWDFFMDKIISVYCSGERQRERIRKSTDLTEKEIDGILGLQLSQQEKIKRADFAIPNERSLAELKIKAREVFDKISKEVEVGS